MSMRDLPSVDRLVRSLDSDLPRALLTEVARSSIDEARDLISVGKEADATAIAASRVRMLQAARKTRVINATGVLLHTNLGRAPIPAEAADKGAASATGYGNLEFDLSTGKRGSRTGYLKALLAAITGAGAAMVVNNNAGALFLTLMALGDGGQVPVARGELIEIGGSYRLPELMEASGVDLVEVGTTNRTRAADYRKAAKPALLLKIHPSNYQVSGFTEEASLEQLAELGSDFGVPLVFDAGSGLVDSACPWVSGPPPPWLSDEPGVLQALQAGADLVMFSGDKLFGGPQAGIIVGRADLISRLESHPVARALRIDGPTAAALTVVAESYASGTAAELPFWRMALCAEADLRQRSTALLEKVGSGEIIESFSTPGAGSVPGGRIPGPAVAFKHAGLHERLLTADPPVVARTEKGMVLIDLRSVDPDDDRALATVLEAACR